MRAPSDASTSSATHLVCHVRLALLELGELALHVRVVGRAARRVSRRGARIPSRHTHTLPFLPPLVTFFGGMLVDGWVGGGGWWWWEASRPGVGNTHLDAPRRGRALRGSALAAHGPPRPAHVTSGVGTARTSRPPSAAARRRVCARCRSARCLACAARLPPTAHWRVCSARTLVMRASAQSQSRLVAVRRPQSLQVASQPDCLRSPLRLLPNAVPLGVASGGLPATLAAAAVLLHALTGGACRGVIAPRRDSVYTSPRSVSQRLAGDAAARTTRVSARAS
jgi:hypothetical protein